MFRFLSGFGSYWMLLGKVFSRPEKTNIYYKQTVKEVISLGIRSIGIVTIISFFMGAVITLQTAYNTENPIYPTYLIGLGCRDFYSARVFINDCGPDPCRQGRVKHSFRDWHDEGDRTD